MHAPTFRLLAIAGGAALIAVTSAVVTANVGNAEPAKAAPLAGTVVMDNEQSIEPNVAWFVAAPGVANRITIRQLGFSTVEITDRAGRIAAAVDCVSISASTARCDAKEIKVYTDDGDDQVTARTEASKISVFGGVGDDVLSAGSSTSTRINGGLGDDVLTGGDSKDTVEGEDGADIIDGGGGNDALIGGRGADELSGGSGDDTIFGELMNVAGGESDYASDRLDGGVGTDTADYSWSSEGVTVTLDGVANDGIPGENDNVLTEHVRGSSKNDVLRGGNEGNRLEGKDGNDKLYGMGGPDFLDAGFGAGELTDGGSGIDLCRPIEADVTRVSCEAS